MRRPLLMRHSLLFIIGSILSLIPYPGLTAPPTDPGKTQSKRDLEQWIKDLASDSFEQREAARRELVNLGEEPPGLRKGLESPDLEVRRRVASILETYLAKRAQRGLERARGLAKERRVDEMVERLVCWRDWIKGDEEWRAVAEFVAGLIEWEHRTYGNTRFLSPGFRHVPPAFHRKDFSPKDTITPNDIAQMWTHSRHILDQEIVLNAKEVKSSPLVVLASGDVRTPALSRSSVLIANGNVHMQESPSDSVIICGEDLDISGWIQNCLVIARGKITSYKESRISNSIILSSGPVTFSGGVTVEDSTIVCGAPMACPKSLALGKRACITTSTPLWPLKFFDPEFEGLTVWQVYRNNGILSGEPPLLAFPDGLEFAGGVQANSDVGAGVQIKKIRKETPFNGGLNESEIIIAIGKEATPSKESFRKILRRKLAESEPIITFTVRRTDKILEATWDGNGWLVKHSDKVGRVDQIVEVPIRVKD